MNAPRCAKGCMPDGAFIAVSAGRRRYVEAHEQNGEGVVVMRKPGGIQAEGEESRNSAEARDDDEEDACDEDRETFETHATQGGGHTEGREVDGQRNSQEVGEEDSRGHASKNTACQGQVL